ncbi:hypothetical protein Hanom_Chr17g01541391 [Helianthus anomalus]
MELTSRMKTARFQTFWIQMRKKTNQLTKVAKLTKPQGRKWHFTLRKIMENACLFSMSTPQEYT